MSFRGASFRSMLFAPANHPRHAPKALAGGADAVILDLEDAVAVDQKPAARRSVRTLLQNRGSEGPAAYVRINSLTTPFAHQDLLGVVMDGLDGVVLPKAESGADVATLDWLLGQLEEERGMEPGRVRVMPLIETAAGLHRIHEIATASRRIAQITFGAGDFTLDNNMEWTPGNEGVLWGRVQTVIAARAAGLTAPVDTVFPALQDLDGFAEEARQGKRLGFQGKLCLHPSQVAVANQVFTPSAAELADAGRVLEAFERAVAAGSASIQLEGRFIDYPIAERARRVIASGRRANVGEVGL